MRSITLRTTQNVSIEYELAGSMSRIFAFVLDILAVGGSYMLMLAILAPDLPGMVLSVYLPLSLFLIYYFLTELLSGGQTMGKRVQGIKVVRADGREMTPGDFLLRTIFLLPDAWFSLGIPAILLINTSARAQRLGDMVAHTVVIRSRGGSAFGLQDILSIQTREDYEPQFPSVQRLPESDLLLIKDTLLRHQRYANDGHRQALDRLAERCRELLDLREEATGTDNETFLQTLLRDYIVLTR